MHASGVRRKESLQHRFTKRLPCLAILDYLFWPAIFDLEYLELRRIRHDLVPAYKIISRLLDLDSSIFSLFIRTPQHIVTVTNLLLVATKLARFLDFIRSIANVCNSLPANVYSVQVT